MEIQANSRKEREVWQACDQLASEGSQVTYQAVGDRLVRLGYRRGSNSDIHRYLTTWKKGKQRLKQAPDPLSDALDRFKKDIWANAHEDIESIKRELKEKTHALALAQERIQELEKSSSWNQQLSTLVQAVATLSESRDKELIKLYEHHQEQFDHYLRAMNASRERNSKLVSQLKYLRLEHQMALEKAMKGEIIKSPSLAIEEEALLEES